MGHAGRLGTGTVTTGSSTGTITLTAGAAVGCTVIVGVGWEAGGGGGVPTITGVTDSRGNTYAVDVSAGATTNTTVAITIGRGAVSTALQIGDTITVTISGGTRSRWPLVAEAFDDVLTSASPLDTTQHNDDPGNSGSLVTGTTAATTEAHELVVALFGFGSGRAATIDTANGWAGGGKVETNAGSADRAIQLIWKYVTATGAQQGTLTVSPSSTYAGAVATYKLNVPSGSADVAMGLAVTATGTKQAAGSAAVPLALAVTATGTKHATGSATVNLALGLDAGGTRHTGIGTPPRPRTRWQLVIGPAAGGHELALTEARNRRYTARLTQNSDLSFSLDGRHEQATAIEELQTDAHLLFSTASSTRILDRCRVGSTRDSIDNRQHQTEVSCLDYRAVLDRRRLTSGDTLTYTGEDQTDIAWGLIAATQGHAAGNLGIVKGIGDDYTGVARDRTFEAGDSIGQRIQELSEVLDGFEWDILPDSPSSLRFDAWYPRRGSDRGVVLIVGGLAESVSRELNPSDYANALRYTGADGLNAAELDAAYLGVPGVFPQGRWDAVYGDDSLQTQGALDDRAAWQLAQAQVVTAVYTVRLAHGAWEGPDHIWVGDTVRLILPSGRLQVDTAQRVHEVQIDIDEDGGETVTLTLGGPRPDFRRWPSVIEQRLTNLERR